ncbi:MAG: hypothetical protein Q9207_006964 [Kuettlingeria erythrocarpa]
MASKTINPPADDSDDFSDYNVDMQDTFRDVNVSMDVTNREQPAHAKPRDKDLGLGLDEEIKVVKKRQPVPKLDDNRLLSQAGIPKLRRLAKERLKFKGKGHEYSDLASLLYLYQLWLDDLYPRAKFADGLAMIEKLGHSKRIQAMRREWINEGKFRESFGDKDVPQADQKATKASEVESTAPATHQAHALVESRSRPSSSLTDEDLYGATPPPRRDNSNQDLTTGATGINEVFIDDGDSAIPEDDLDALLAEPAPDNQKTYSAESSRQGTTLADRNGEFDAEMEVMAEMDDMW